MSHRAGSILFFSIAGALCGFYVALGYEFFIGETRWPSPLMFWLSLLGFSFGFLLIKDSFPDDKEVYREQKWDERPYLTFTKMGNDQDFIIVQSYPTQEEINLIRERMYMIRTGRIRVPKNKTHGDIFKELMEDSDSQDV